MPVFDLPFSPTIRIIFKGFTIMRVRDGAASAEIGALANSPCHQPRITVTKITPEGRPVPFDMALPEVLTENFSLSVENALHPGIQVFQKNPEQFNRLDEAQNDSRDFRWILNLEEFFKKPVAIDANKLKPKFSIDSGIFYTSAKSQGEVKVQRQGSDFSSRFGRYGLDIGVNVYFDPKGNDATRKAVFKYGNTEIFTVTEAEKNRYQIEYNCDCEIDRDESDFPLIFDVIGASLNDADKKLTLVGDALRPGFSHTPETYCGPGQCSTC